MVSVYRRGSVVTKWSQSRWTPPSRSAKLLIPLNGEMSEWLKEHAWKACVGETLPRVRIPLSPPPSSPAARSLGLERLPGFERLARAHRSRHESLSLSSFFGMFRPSSSVFAHGRLGARLSLRSP